MLYCDVGVLPEPGSLQVVVWLAQANARAGLSTRMACSALSPTRRVWRAPVSCSSTAAPHRAGRGRWRAQQYARAGKHPTEINAGIADIESVENESDASWERQHDLLAR